MTDNTADSAGKVFENRLRRMAKRQGLKLEKSRSRDRRALDYGTWRLTEIATGNVVFNDGPAGYGRTLEEVETYLNTDPTDR